MCVGTNLSMIKKTPVEHVFATAPLGWPGCIEKGWKGWKGRGYTQTCASNGAHLQKTLAPMFRHFWEQVGFTLQGAILTGTWTIAT